MRSAPTRIAWSRKALNLIAALHSTSGLGVRPAWCSRRNSANTRSLYSAAKLTCSISMPSTSATLAASRKSWRVEQYSSSSSSSQFFMKMPMTSCPCFFNRWAVTAESTPPDKPTTTRCFFTWCSLQGGGEDRLVGRDQRQREVDARQVVVDAAQQQRAAVPVHARADLVGRHPQCTHDAGVERARGVGFADRAAEGDAQVG